MLRFMLDTNICLYTIKNKPETVREQFNRYQGQLCISSVSLMALTFGTEKSAAPQKNLAVLEGFAARLDILDFGRDAATHCGQLRTELAKIGKPIGPYDQMIAAHARAEGLTLVTSNVREFERVPDLRIIDWVTKRT